MKKTNKKNNNNSKTLILVIALIMAIALIIGGTYAYWVWNSNNIVSVNVTTNLGSTGLTLDGGSTTNNKLAPAACTHASYANKKTITIKRYNDAAFPASVTLTLKLTSFTWSHAKPADADLAHIHYALVNSTGASSCTTGVVSATGNSGTFSGATLGSTANTANNPNKTLITWNYEIPVGGTSGSQVTETYYLYTWLDTSYTFTNYGSGAIQDPLEDISYTLTWSASTITQHS